MKVRDLDTGANRRNNNQRCIRSCTSESERPEITGLFGRPGLPFEDVGDQGSFPLAEGEKTCWTSPRMQGSRTTWIRNLNMGKVTSMGGTVYWQHVDVVNARASASGSCGARLRIDAPEQGEW